MPSFSAIRRAEMNIRPVAMRQAMPAASAAAIAPAVRGEGWKVSSSTVPSRSIATARTARASSPGGSCSTAGVAGTELYLPATDATYAATFAASWPVRSFGRHRGAAVLDLRCDPLGRQRSEAVEVGPDVAARACVLERMAAAAGRAERRLARGQIGAGVAAGRRPCSRSSSRSRRSTGLARRCGLARRGGLLPCSPSLPRPD